MAARRTLLALLMVAATGAAGGHAAAAGGKVQAAGSSLCCTNTTGYQECVVACFGYYPREQAEKICDPGCQEAYQCRTVPGGEKCPTSSSLLHRSSESDLLTDKVVGEVVVQLDVAAATTTTLCCSNMTGFHECVHDCFAYFPREQAEKICDPGCKEAYQCRTVSGDKCPSAGKVVQAVATTLCCSNMTGFHECVHDCFGYFPREQAEKICDPGCKEAYQCRTVSGDKCPSSSGEFVQAVTTTLCCSNMTGFQECVHDCFAYFPREQAEKICDPGCKEAYQCRTVSGDKCPTNSGIKGDAVEKCVSGCQSSVCSKMITGVGSSKVVAVKVKHAAVDDRCDNACYRFCTKGLSAGTASA